MNLFSYGKHPKGTSGLSFFECPFDYFVKGFLQWRQEIGKTCQTYAINGLQWKEFFQTYDNLNEKYIITPTNSKWTVFFDNSLSGYPEFSIIYYMAQSLKIRSVGISIDYWDCAKENQRPYGLAFNYFDGRSEFTGRTIALICDGGKWTFDSRYAPLPFEDINRYNEKKKKDRFDLEMLTSYLLALGIDLHDENWLLPNKAIGIVESYKQQASCDFIQETANKLIDIASQNENGTWIVYDGSNNSEYRFRKESGENK